MAMWKDSVTPRQTPTPAPEVKDPVRFDAPPPKPELPPIDVLALLLVEALLLSSQRCGDKQNPWSEDAIQLFHATSCESEEFRPVNGLKSMRRAGTLRRRRALG